jgi:hypothetical protein
MASPAASTSDHRDCSSVCGRVVAAAAATAVPTGRPLSGGWSPPDHSDSCGGDSGTQLPPLSNVPLLLLLLLLLPVRY